MRSRFRQRPRDLFPLFFKRISRGWRFCPAIPVRCVGRVTFLAMQVGMYPRSCRTLILLRRFMRFGPVPFRIPPEANDGKAQPGRR